MTAIDNVRRATVDMYKYVVREYNRERIENFDLPSSRAVTAYLKGAIAAYSVTLKNLRYYKKQEAV